jgi:lactoylglutathione lyase
MNIDHVAIWTIGLEKMRLFYETYFGGTSGDKYVNAAKGFESYFLNFSAGARLELMHRPDIPSSGSDIERQAVGLVHFAFSADSRRHVDQLTNRLRTDGYRIVDGPRTTGDGCYESCVLDPEGNRVEISVPDETS